MVPLVFQGTLPPGRCTGGRRSRKIACSLHRRPYEIYVRGAKMPVDYLVGVATHPAARGKGLATELIRGAFHMARMEIRALSFLCPRRHRIIILWDFHFMRTSGNEAPRLSI